MTAKYVSDKMDPKIWADKFSKLWPGRAANMEKYGQEYKASYCQEGQILQNIGRNIKQTMAKKGIKYGKIWAGILSKL